MNQLTKLATALAVSTMAMGANAATYNFDVVQDVLVSGLATGTGTGSGTAVWDDLAGTLAMSMTTVVSSPVGDVTTDSSISMVGAAGSPFAPTSGQSTVTSCAGSSTACGNVTLNTPSAFIAVGGSLTLASGSLTSSLSKFGGAIRTDSTYTLTAPAAVPVPAAAWLFGSGLIGLAGVARRRRA